MSSMLVRQYQVSASGSTLELQVLKASRLPVPVLSSLCVHRRSSPRRPKSLLPHRLRRLRLLPHTQRPARRPRGLESIHLRRRQQSPHSTTRHAACIRYDVPLHTRKSHRQARRRRHNGKLARHVQERQIPVRRDQQPGSVRCAWSFQQRENYKKRVERRARHDIRIRGAGVDGECERTRHPMLLSLWLSHAGRRSVGLQQHPRHVCGMGDVSGKHLEKLSKTFS